jgi:cold-inducible RNA-binding protein
MGKKLFVGNLDYVVTDDDLMELFKQYGTVQSAQVIKDRDTGRSRGFGFIEMAKDEEAEAAISAVNGQQMNGRAVTVNEAQSKERSARPGRSNQRIA